MSIKAIVTDLDGTLFNHTKTLSEQTRQVMQRCHEHGILLIPATGRTLEGVPDMIKSLPAVRYLILTNGARIYDKETDENLSEHLIPQKTAAEILMNVDRFHVLYDVYINGRGKGEERFLMHLDEYGIEPEIQKLIRRTRDPVPNIIRYVLSQNQMVDKINLYFDDLQLRERFREELGKDKRLAVSSSLYNNLELNHCDATKGNAVRTLAKRLGFQEQELMVCGDGDNDRSMMLPGALKIAMENADPKLKSLADYITKSNEESGVAYAIERFVWKTGDSFYDSL